MTREVRVPKWGLTIEHVRIASWLKEVGDEVRRATRCPRSRQTRPNPRSRHLKSGRVVELVASVDDECAVGDVVAILETKRAA